MKEKYRPLIDRCIDYAHGKNIPLAALMVAEAEVDDLARNGCEIKDGAYRGVPVELHDEWSWGWMLRTADGKYVDEDMFPAMRDAA